MAVQTTSTILDAQSDIAKAQSILNLNSWQLLPASYNGVLFHTIVKGYGLSVLNNLVPSVDDFFSNLTSVLGLNGNDNSRLAHGTQSVITESQDSGRRKLKVFRIPDQSYDILQDLGWEGETFSFVGIITGRHYQDATNNIFNAFLNDQNVDIEDRNVLVHPTRGRIPNAFLVSYRRIHTGKIWRSLTYEFTFRCSAAQLQSAPLSNANNLLNKINDGISAVNAAVNLVTDTISLATSLTNIYFPTNASTSQGTVSAALANATSTNTSIQTAAATVYQNFKPDSFNSYAADTGFVATASAAAASPITSTYTQIGFQQVDSIISTLSTTIQSTLDTLKSAGEQNTQGVISALKSAFSSVSQLSQNLLASYYNASSQYTVPYDMSIRMVCFLNNLDFDSNIKKILTLNSNNDDFFSVNYISSGTAIRIPNATTSSQ